MPDEDAVPAKGTPEVLRPAAPEPPATESRSTFTIDVPILPPVRPNNSITKIGDFAPGLETGVERGSSMNAPSIYAGTELDTTPRARFQVAPQYPFAERREGIHGEVFVEFVVDETGAVLSPRVVHSSSRAFEEPTLRAVAKWRFEPGKRDGHIVRFRMAVPVFFKLDRE